MNVKRTKNAKQRIPIAHVMRIELNAETGELLGVWDNDTKVEGHKVKRGDHVMLNVPIGHTNPSTLIFSTGSGCTCYWRDGRLICVPAG